MDKETLQKHAEKLFCYTVASRSCPENMKAIFLWKQFQHLTERALKETVASDVIEVPRWK
jgi:hypothetical protein